MGLVQGRGGAKTSSLILFRVESFKIYYKVQDDQTPSKKVVLGHSSPSFVVSIMRQDTLV